MLELFRYSYVLFTRSMDSMLLNRLVDASMMRVAAWRSSSSCLFFLRDCTMNTTMTSTAATRTPATRIMPARLALATMRFVMDAGNERTSTQSNDASFIM